MKKVGNQFIALIIVLTGMIFNPSFAFEEDEVGSEEIAYLIKYIGNADCTFNRNGTEYSAYHAKLFIEHKYGKGKDKINSTEEFIKLSATKSTSSGIDYLVECGDDVITSADWLTKELASYRSVASIN